MNSRPDEIPGSSPQLNDDLTRLYAVSVPALRWIAPRERSKKAMSQAGAWRRAGILTAGATIAAAAVAAIVVVPTLGGGTATVSAQTIVARAEANADPALAVAVQPYHAIAVTTLEGKQGTITETWVADATHFRSEQHSASNAGGVASNFGVGRDGDDMWLYIGKTGSERAVQGPPSVLNSVAADVVVPRQSLAEMLRAYESTACSQVEQRGTATVAGRAAYVVAVSPDPEHCTDIAMATKLRSEGHAASTMWVDEQTFLPLRVELRDGTGTVTYRYDTTQIEVGAAARTTNFRYDPPAGVSVVHVTSANGFKAALLDQRGAGGAELP